ncbi:ribosome biogenesis protein WDR12, partial [Trifolium pratense]
MLVGKCQLLCILLSFMSLCVETVTLATASKDRTLRLWKINTEEEATDHPLRVRAYKILRGHKSSVQSVAAQTNGEMVCSGSWDCTINLWRINDTNAENDFVSKKRKVEGQVEDSQLE